MSDEAAELTEPPGPEAVDPLLAQPERASADASVVAASRRAGRAGRDEGRKILWAIGSSVLTDTEEAMLILRDDPSRKY
jgi:hypothetical protein